MHGQGCVRKTAIFSQRLLPHTSLTPKSRLSSHIGGIFFKVQVRTFHIIVIEEHKLHKHI